MLVATLVFISVTLAFLSLLIWLRPNRSQARFEALSGHEVRVAWRTAVLKASGPFARLSVPDGNWEHAPLRRKFFHAGLRDGDARIIYFAAKTILPVAVGLLTYATLLASSSSASTLQQVFYVLLAATAACYVPNLVLYLLVRRRQREIFENFPDAADLLLVCVEAGLALDAALGRVADEMRIKSMAVAEEIQLTNLEVRAGGTREQALRNLALRTGLEEIGTFAMMLVQADKFGTSIGDSLRVFSEDLRHRRQARAEEKAAKVPTKMLFPLVTCIFPAIIMVILGPAIIQIIRTVLPSISGTQ